MKFVETAVKGVVIVDIEPHADDRGFFARSFCTEEFAAHGLDADVAQANIQHNQRAGTVRGMHRQVPPHAEGKLVRCVRGAMLDCALDLREDSTTLGRHVQVELTEDNHRALFIPPYVAHGMQTLADDTEVLYLMFGPYVPGSEHGVRHDDPAFGISWPRPVEVIAEKDLAWPAWTGPSVACDGSATP